MISETYMVTESYSSKQRKRFSTIDCPSWESYGMTMDENIKEIMFKNSKLCPVPEGLELKNHEKCKKEMSSLTIKVRAILNRILMENHYRLKQHTINPNENNAKHVPLKKCEKFIKTIERSVQSKFRTLCHQISSMMKEGEFKIMDVFLEKTKEWIKDVENKVKERFNQHVEFSLLLLEKHDKITAYNMYLSKAHTDLIEEEGPNAFSEQLCLGREDQAIAFNLRTLYSEVNKIIEKDEKNMIRLEQEVDNLYKKALKSGEDYSNSSDSEDRD